MKRKTLVCIMIIFIITAVPILSSADANSVTTYTGKGNAGYADDKLEDAKLNAPYGIIFDGAGMIIVDSNNNRIRQVKNGQVSTLAGTSEYTDGYNNPVGGLVDGQAAKAYFNKPRDIVRDSKGNYYVSDTLNHVIRKITNGQVYTFAGNGKAGYQDGKASAAMFNMPSGLAVDSKDNIYVADTLNNCVRKITPNGDVTTYAGKQSAAGGYEDGPAANAKFNEPADVEIYKDIVYVLDSGNHLVRKIEGGKVETYAGALGEMMEDTSYRQGGYQDGTADIARFNFPKGFKIMDNGTMFIADTWNHRIRAVKPDKTVVTVLGGGASGFVNGAIQTARLNTPVDVAYKDGVLYISDMWNNAIRSVTVDINNPVMIPDDAAFLSGLALEKTSEIQVWLNKERIVFPDAKPLIKDGEVYIPVRFILEKWGAEVTWSQSERKVMLTKGAMNKSLIVNNTKIFINQDRTYILSNNLSQLTGLYIRWFPEYNALIIINGE